jgi:tocopherol cyclase
VPFMECYHGIVSMDHGIQGALQVDGAEIDMGGGRGYIEKDWGRRFPAAWVWFQSNHWSGERVSVSASVALIPWLGRSFRGFIIGVWHAGTLYRFATYTGARIERLSIDDAMVRLVVEGRQQRLELEIERHEPGQLYAPDIDDMSGRVGETMQAAATVRLTERGGHGASTDVVLYEGAARFGALEVVGDMRLLTSE